MVRSKETTTDPIFFGVWSVALVGLGFFMLLNPGYIADLAFTTGTPFDEMWLTTFQPLLSFAWTMEVALVLGGIGIILFFMSFFGRAS